MSRVIGIERAFLLVGLADQHNQLVDGAFDARLGVERHVLVHDRVQVIEGLQDAWVEEALPQLRRGVLILVDGVPVVDEVLLQLHVQGQDAERGEEVDVGLGQREAEGNDRIAVAFLDEKRKVGKPGATALKLTWAMPLASVVVAT